MNDLVMDLRDMAVPMYEVTYKGASHRLNFCIDVRIHRNLRDFLRLDSVLVSADRQRRGIRPGSGKSASAGSA